MLDVRQNKQVVPVSATYNNIISPHSLHQMQRHSKRRAVVVVIVQLIQRHRQHRHPEHLHQPIKRRHHLLHPHQIRRHKRWVS